MIYKTLEKLEEILLDVNLLIEKIETNFLLYIIEKYQIKKEKDLEKLNYNILVNENFIDFMSLKKY